MATNSKKVEVKPERDYPLVHHMVRTIGEYPVEGAVSAEFADAHVSAWIEKGYKLHSTHFIGLEPRGFNVLYILVKEPS